MLRAVVFDAVGTLIHAFPAVSQVYATIGKKHGSRFSPDEITNRFRAAFRQQEDIDRLAAWATNEARELRRWREIVAKTLPDADREACFAELYEHFARSTAWALDPAARDVIAQLRRDNVIIAMASNFDERLHGIIAGLPPLDDLDAVIISSQVGARKPARSFFEAIEKRLGIPGSQIAFVGDDPINDGQGAADAGMQSILLGRDVKSLAELAVFQWRLR